MQRKVYFYQKDPSEIKTKMSFSLEKEVPKEIEEMKFTSDKVKLLCKRPPVNLKKYLFFRQSISNSSN